MADYYLGKARGEVVVDYDDTGLTRAEKGFDRAGQAADKTAREFKDLGRESKRLEDQTRQTAQQTAAMSRLQEEARIAAERRALAEKELNKILKDSKTTVEQSQAAHEKLSRARVAQIAANNALRRAERALAAEITATNAALDKATGAGGGRDREVKIGADTKTALMKVARLNAAIPNKRTVNVDVDTGSAMMKIAALNRALAMSGKVGGVGMLGAGAGGALGLLGAGGLGAILPGLMGAVAAVGELSRAAGVLPGVIGASVLALGTIKIATYGFGDALKAVMTGDVKKFAEALQKMSPVAQRAALEFYKFGDTIKGIRNSVGDSFFAPWVKDISALGSTYLPMLQGAMNGIAGSIGNMVHEWATFMQTSEGISLTQGTFDSMKAGIEGLVPAIQPFTKAWSQIMSVSSSFLPQLSAELVKVAERFGAFIDRVTASGQFSEWIQSGIDAVKSLLNTLGQFGSAFSNIWQIASTTGGGFLETLNRVATTFNEWTSSVSGQNALSKFFTSLSTAAEAFMPVLKTLGEALLGQLVPALANLGTAIAPGLDAGFKAIGDAIEILGDALLAGAPALNQFLTTLGGVVKEVVTNLAPVLPTVMQAIADTLSELAPILPELATALGELLIAVAPLLPQLAKLITPAIVGLLQDFTKIMIELAPYVAKVAEWIGNLAARSAEGKKQLEELTGHSSALGLAWQGLKDVIANIVESFKTVWNWLQTIGEWFGKIGDLGSAMGIIIGKGWDKLVDKVKEVWENIKKVVTDFIPNLVKEGIEAGKKLIEGLMKGIRDKLGPLGTIMDKVGQVVADYTKPGSPTKKGPLSGSGWTYLSGKRLMDDLAQGIADESAAVAAAARGAAQGISDGTASGGARGNGGGAGSTAVGSTTELNTIGQFVKDMMQITDLFASLVDFGEQISEIVFQTLDFVKQINPNHEMFQGKWERKPNTEENRRATEDANYRKGLEDQRKLDEQRSSPGYLNPIPGNAPPEISQALVGAPGDLKASASQQDIANYIMQKALSKGFTPDEAKAFVIQAMGESGLKPGAYGATTGDASGGASGIFQFTPDTWKDFGAGGNAMNARDNIEAYFRLFESRDPGMGSIKDRLAAVSVGGPAHSSNVGHWDTASKLAQPFINAFEPAVDQFTKSVESFTAGAQQLSNVPERLFNKAQAGQALPAGAAAPMETQYGYMYRGHLVNKDGGEWKYAQQEGYQIPDIAGITKPIAQAATQAAMQAAGQQVPIRGVAANKGTPYTSLSPGTDIRQGAAGFPDWVYQVGKAFDIEASTYAGHQSGRGYNQGIDWWPEKNAQMYPGAKGYSAQELARMDALAEWLGTQPGVEQVIWENPVTRNKIGYAYGERVGPGTDQPQYYAQDWAGHQGHIHTRHASNLVLPGQFGYQPGTTGMLPTQASPLIPEAQSIVAEQQAKQLSIEEQQLEVLKQQNPLLQKAIDVAQNPLSSETDILSGLETISAESRRQREIDTAQSRLRADALDSAASKIADTQGMQQGASPVETAQQAVSGMFSIASDVVGLIKTSLQSVAAADELTTQLITGVRGTEDLFKMIDHVQVFIEHAAQVAQTVGSVASTAASLAGASGDGGMASMALQAVAMVSQMVSAGLQMTNAAIDIGQEVYRIAGKYVGGFLATLAGGGEGALMGDVKYMLDKNTGELISYSGMAPEDKRKHKVPGWLNWAYDYRGGEGGMGMQAQLNVYAGPGQSVHDTMNETMWLVHAGGNTAGPMNNAGAF